MKSVDLAVTAAGSITGELVHLGIPFLQVVLADNQQYVAEGWERKGVAPNLGKLEDLNDQRLLEELEKLFNNPQRFEKGVLRGSEFVDGNGARRVLDVLEDEVC
ncbi:MAG: hypothetical protein ABEK50_09225 [bacterium]